MSSPVRLAGVTAFVRGLWSRKHGKHQDAKRSIGPTQRVQGRVPIGYRPEMELSITSASDFQILMHVSAWHCTISPIRRLAILAHRERQQWAPSLATRELRGAAVWSQAACPPATELSSHQPLLYKWRRHGLLCLIFPAAPPTCHQEASWFDRAIPHSLDRSCTKLHSQAVPCSSSYCLATNWLAMPLTCRRWQLGSVCFRRSE